jgi:hypothetical protein
MKKKTVLTAMLLACLAGGMAWSQQQRQFDLGRDFSSGKNPAGVWQYGYSATPTLDPKQTLSFEAIQGFAYRRSADT